MVREQQKKKPFVPSDQSFFQLDPRNSTGQMNAISKNHDQKIILGYKSCSELLTDVCDHRTTCAFNRFKPKLT